MHSIIYMERHVKYMYVKYKYIVITSSGLKEKHRTSEL